MLEIDNPNTKGIIRDSKGRFVPGYAPNPNGRPLGSISLADKLRKRLSTHPEEADAIVQALVMLAKNSDMRAIEHSFAYIDGKPVERHRIEGELPLRLVFVPALEMLNTPDAHYDANLGILEGETIPQLSEGQG